MSVQSSMKKRAAALALVSAALVVRGGVCNSPHEYALESSQVQTENAVEARVFQGAEKIAEKVADKIIETRQEQVQPQVQKEREEQNRRDMKEHWLKEQLEMVHQDNPFSSPPKVEANDPGTVARGDFEDWDPVLNPPKEKGIVKGLKNLFTFNKK